MNDGFSGSGMLGALGAVMGVIWLISMIMCVIMIISQWKIFKKAGEPGVAAIVPFTTDYFVVPEFHVICLSTDGIEMFDLSGDKAEIEWLKVDWDVSRSGKGGYPFYMEKEIMEQPQVIKETVLPRIRDGKPDFSKEGIPDEILRDCKRICVIACGTAMHAGLVGKSLI